MQGEEQGRVQADQARSRHGVGRHLRRATWCSLQCGRLHRRTEHSRTMSTQVIRSRQPTGDQQLLAVWAPCHAVHVLPPMRCGHAERWGAARPRVPQEQRVVVACGTGDRSSKVELCSVKGQAAKRKQLVRFATFQSRFDKSPDPAQPSAAAGRLTHAGQLYSAVWAPAHILNRLLVPF